MVLFYLKQLEIHGFLRKLKLKEEEEKSQFLTLKDKDYKPHQELQYK